ncbi:MAG: S1C family serine protease [Planctomycetes bacterium]|nr:S1C family serine protease [Planctomycetota bacterium]
MILALLLLLAPENPDELLALEAAIENALRAVDASVVTIETVGGVRPADLPGSPNEKMTLPARPRDEKDAPKEGEPKEEEEPAPEGRTPRFGDEFKKMLAMPGFQKAEGPTTGVILSPDGYIVTSAWNFESSPTVVTVTTADGRTTAAKLLGIDRAAGLALLKIERDGLPHATFLDPKDVAVGAWAFAVGRALDKRPDVKYGIISAKNRIEGNALQTDAATSPSNYGGPLVDLEGRVYGIIVPLGAGGEDANPNWYDSGIGFVAPVPDPAALIRRLGKEGVELEPAFLGVTTDQDRPGPGALITDIVPETAAAKAGLRKGDVVLAVDGAPVPHAFGLRFEIGRRRAGDKARLTVSRDGTEVELEAELDKRPEAQAPTEKIPVPMPGPDGKPPEPKEKG